MARVEKITEENKIDVWHILYNLREIDAKELIAMQGDLMRDATFRIITGNREPHQYIVYADDKEPVAVFGIRLHVEGAPLGWALGTERWPLGVRAITRHARKVIFPDLVARGVKEAQCFSIDEHKGSEKWLRSMGVEEETRFNGVGYLDRENVIRWCWRGQHVEKKEPATE